MIRRIFRRWLRPVQVRNSDGRFLPSRVTARKKAIEMAQAMNRNDLIERLQA